ncbi:MAG: glycerophosphodiester phosphodiesterase [Anaerolineaceae bacterium]
MAELGKGTSAGATSPPGGMVPGRAGPALIAHGAGNSPVRVASATEEGADFLEVDLWLHHGRFEARHERAVYPIPLLFEKWYLRWAPKRPFGLAELLGAAAGRARVFLDMKSGGEEAARLLCRSIEAAGAVPRIAASAQQWRFLRAIHAIVPEVETFYSIDVQAKLDLFLSVHERDRQPKGVSCRHFLLSAEVVQRLHERDLWVNAWTVDDVERAQLLAAWGVDAITTNHVGDLRKALVRP